MSTVEVTNQKETKRVGQRETIKKGGAEIDPA